METTNATGLDRLVEIYRQMEALADELSPSMAEESGAIMYASERIQEGLMVLGGMPEVSERLPESEYD